MASRFSGRARLQQQQRQRQRFKLFRNVALGVVAFILGVVVAARFHSVYKYVMAMRAQNAGGESPTTVTTTTEHKASVVAGTTTTATSGTGVVERSENIQIVTSIRNATAADAADAAGVVSPTPTPTPTASSMSSSSSSLRGEEEVEEEEGGGGGTLGSGGETAITKPASSDDVYWSKREAEYMRYIREQGHVFITFVSSSMTEFAFNWYELARDAGLKPLLVGALDDKMLYALRDADVPCVSLNGTHTLGVQQESYCGTHCKHFKKMGPVKIGFIKYMVQHGIVTVVSDADVAWLRTPIDYVREAWLRNADMLISQDCIDIISDKEDTGGCAHVAFNTGQMVWFPTPRSLAVLDRWSDLITSSTETWMRDQPALNQVIRSKTDIGRVWRNARHPSDKEMRHGGADGGVIPKEVARGIFNVSDEGSLSIVSLPTWLFMNGHTFFVQQYQNFFTDDTRPFSVHPTYQYGDVPKFAFGKRQRMREFGVWKVDPDSYFTEGNFLVVNNLIATPSPVKMAVGIDTRIPLRRHFDEDTYRRTMLREAIAVAFALRRILILPRAWCYCDKIWNNLIGCRSPGSERQATLPFVCPLDHIFDPQSLFDPDVQLVGVREYNFLDNPRVPDEVRKSVARVRVLRGSEDDADGGARATARMDESLNELYMNRDNGGVNVTQAYAAMDWDVRVRAGLSSDDLRTQLQAVEKYRVLEFSDVRGLLCSYSSPEDEKRADAYTKAHHLKFNAFFCSTEAWVEMGKPRSNPWEPGVIKRHCGVENEHSLQTQGLLHRGHVSNYTTCACEFGFSHPDDFLQSRREYESCQPRIRMTQG